MASAARAANSLLSVIKRDHHAIFTDYQNYLNAKSSGDIDTQSRWARQLVWEVARHSVGEELVVYPLFEKHLGSEGLEMATRDRQEHQQVKNLLYDFESLSAGSAEYDRNLKDVITALTEHIKGEEENDLPKLEKAIGLGTSQSEAVRFLRTKRFAPTRAHPSAPDKPPFETIAGLLAAPLDKLKDAFAKFPKEEPRGPDGYY